MQGAPCCYTHAEMALVPDNEVNQAAAAGLLGGGGVVAYPTDTLYGLGASLAHAPAVERVFAIKGRPTGQGIPVLIASWEQLEQVAAEVPGQALELAQRFWPGALTLVLRKRPTVPDAATGGGDTVAVRQPDHPTPLSLIAACGPITGTSANLSGGPQPTTAQEVTRQLGGAVDMVLDGGPALGGVPSTVLDLTMNPPVIVRLGAISIELLREVCPVELALTASAPA